MQIGCALSKNTASILVFRFIGGMFAACPLTVRAPPEHDSQHGQQADAISFGINRTLEL
jgi:hypothetical protein